MGLTKLRRWRACKPPDSRRGCSARPRWEVRDGSRLTGSADQTVATNSHTIWNLTHEGRVVQARLMLWQAWNSLFWIRERAKPQPGEWLSLFVRVNLLNIFRIWRCILVQRQVEVWRQVDMDCGLRIF